MRSWCVAALCGLVACEDPKPPEPVPGPTDARCAKLRAAIDQQVDLRKRMAAWFDHGAKLLDDLVALEDAGQPLREVTRALRVQTAEVVHAHETCAAALA